MRPFCLAIVLTLSSVALAQTSERSFLAYVHVIEVDVASNSSFDACVIVGSDGQYRFELDPPVGNAFASDAKVFRGYLPVKTFDDFKSLVHAPELRNLKSSQPRGSLLPTHDRTTVSLRIHRARETQELVFTTVDGRDPLPPSASAFVPWMKELQKSLGKPDRRARPRNCSGLDLTKDFEPELQKR